MKTKISFLLAVMLVFTLTVTGLAGVELGLSQNYDGNMNLRIDVENFVFSLPLRDDISQFGIGGKLDTPIYDLYGTGRINFRRYSNQWKWDSWHAGIGYPLHFNIVTLRAEFLATNPEWADPDSLTFTTLFGFQFGFRNIFTGGESS